MVFIIMFYTCLVTEVVYHRGGGGQHRIRKSLKLYIVLQWNAMVDIKISIIDICYANTARYLKLWWFLYFINEKFNKNAKVEKLTKKLGRGVRLVVIGPWWCREEGWSFAPSTSYNEMHPLSLMTSQIPIYGRSLIFLEYFKHFI